MQRGNLVMWVVKEFKLTFYKKKKKKAECKTHDPTVARGSVKESINSQTV